MVAREGRGGMKRERGEGGKRRGKERERENTDMPLKDTPNSDLLPPTRPHLLKFPPPPISATNSRPIFQHVSL
jgi:hypothetical protein